MVMKQAQRHHAHHVPWTSHGCTSSAHGVMKT
jgi:hypothetical protein